jgi:very-short-patch-repair endonuclease
VLSHTTAARIFGLEIGLADDVVHVTVPRGGRVRRRRSVVIHWKPLTGSELTEHVTSPLRTVLDCATLLPFPQALAVADSALQVKFVQPQELASAARARRGPGRSACLRVAAWADREAHNAFESVLRGTLIDAGITDLVPQLPVALPRFVAHLDLGDRPRKIAIEADSFTYHSTRDAFSRDCERYDELVAAGWLVLRFTWEQVMFQPEWVVETVQRTREDRRAPRSA